MKYTQLKIELVEAKARLNRTLLVREDLDLVTLGCVIGSAFKCDFEQFFIFRKSKISYIPEVFAEEMELNEKTVLMNEYLLEDLGESFDYIYDIESNWHFKCSVLKKDVEYDSELPSVMLTGNGLGIWENSKKGFDAYIKGDIKPYSSSENPSKGYFMPENLDMLTYGDFDHFDLSEEQEWFKHNVINDIYEYIADSHDNGYEMNIDNLDESLLSDTDYDEEL